MICTPSNAAIDEIIARLKTSGLYDENGKTVKPNIVRVGVLDKTTPEIVKSCSLENLTEA